MQVEHEMLLTPETNGRTVPPQFTPIVLLDKPQSFHHTDTVCNSHEFAGAELFNGITR